MMTPALRPCVLLLACIASSPFRSVMAQSGMPHLEQRGAAKQLVVDGQPMLMIAGELHNSSSSSLAYMDPEWKQLADMGLNTVLTPVSWELVEPSEGHYDFTLLDGLLAGARRQHLHVVVLWLSSWKNGVSGYPPEWVKRDLQRFPRAMQNGQPTSTLSTFSPALRAADSRAFSALMSHLRDVDSRDHTVVMVQVENEVGVLGASRDHGPAADKAFSDAVPPALLKYLQAHQAELNEELRSLWMDNGAKTQGTWTEVFGKSTRTDEIFMAWQYARFVHAVAAAGKSVYPLPMYANAWLGGGEAVPGDYPSGGAQPRVLDVWKAAGDALDMECPDLYASDFQDWTRRYHRADNPLFIPETNGGKAGAAAAFYAFGEASALGFSPFGIDAGMHGEQWPGQDSADHARGEAELASSYHVLSQLAPSITRARQDDAIHGFLLDAEHPSADFRMHGLAIHVSLDQIFGHKAASGYGLLLEESPGHFLGAGRGFRVAFTPVDGNAPRVGLASVEEGHFEAGSWVAGRRLNGDESDQGGYWRFDQLGNHIERSVLYEYK